MLSRSRKYGKLKENSSPKKPKSRLRKTVSQIGKKVKNKKESFKQRAKSLTRTKKTEKINKRKPLSPGRKEQIRKKLALKIIKAKDLKKISNIETELKYLRKEIPKNDLLNLINKRKREMQAPKQTKNNQLIRFTRTELNRLTQRPTVINMNSYMNYKTPTLTNNQLDELKRLRIPINRIKLSSLNQEQKENFIRLQKNINTAIMKQRMKRGKKGKALIAGSFRIPVN
tara:strand:+ start:390 stop:1073 length:684 start_codon:yes stop_codon:yes gene_type:complete